MDEKLARSAICEVGRYHYDRGHVHSTAGNIGVLLDDGRYVMTPGDGCLGMVQERDLALVDEQGRSLGSIRPSKTVGLHLSILAAARRAGSQARSVLHTYSTYCVAASLAADKSELPITP